MAFQLILPDIGEGVVEAEVQKWFVKPGDRVVEDQPLVEVMTDKATVTIPSPRRGLVTRLHWKEGDVAKVHEPLLELEPEEAAGAAESAPPRNGTAATATPTAAAAPATSTTAPSPRSPEQRPEPRSPTRAAAAAAAEAASTEDEERARPGRGVAAVLPNGPAGPARAHGKALATPAVRALARELGVDIHAVRGTGPGGRVTKEDLAAGPTGPPGAGRTAPERRMPAAPEGRAEPARGEIEVVPVRGIRRRIAEHMAQSKRTAAHFTFVEQVDMTDLVKVKDRIAEAAREQGVKVTFLPFVVKASVAALKKHPILNASLHEEAGEIRVKRWFDIGIASATEQGLVVPVVRHADRRSLLDLAREIERLAAESKTGKLRPEDVGGSTFTITSLGALGGLFATPIINYPEVAILGTHRIRPTPVVRDGQIVARDVMHLSLSFDHRVVDGHVAAAFAYDVIRYLEDPNLLFMEMI